MNTDIIKLYIKIIKEISNYYTPDSIFEFSSIKIEKGIITFYFPDDLEQINKERLSMLEIITNRIIKNKKYELFRIGSFLLNGVEFCVELEIKELELVKNYSDNEPTTNEA